MKLLILETKPGLEEVIDWPVVPREGDTVVFQQTYFTVQEIRHILDDHLHKQQVQVWVQCLHKSTETQISEDWEEEDSEEIQTPSAMNIISTSIGPLKGRKCNRCNAIFNTSPKTPISTGDGTLIFPSVVKAGAGV